MTLIYKHFALECHIYNSDTNLMDVLYGTHKNFTWNLILQFYGQQQNCKIKIHKLYGYLPYYCHDIKHKTDLFKIKICQLLIQRQTVKFHYHKIFVQYGTITITYDKVSVVTCVHIDKTDGQTVILVHLLMEIISYLVL